ncbi:S-adenosyl-L-methionine-dependent methyltransferase [Exidia glandulosa HHB12029]|uniref:S-adenosyl-L-methionine-dependent methyltransferase n=1 Tax=Exidia glandulosa HHB12029 TaxID=1314781 RepID=A0A166A994_EXIGL|nr:S-adenosyl-L-methionine-dependent methyltransferase [Exidia glandulosa HHB12029]
MAVEIDTFPRMAELVAKHGNQSAWDVAWQEGTTPWEIKTQQGPLKTFLESAKTLVPKSGRAIVPGCGRGWDVVLLAELTDLQVMGGDLSPTAIRAANDYLSKNTSSAADRISFEVIDYFKYQIPANDRFMLAFDFTFFVALDPPMRPQWGAKINEYVAPGGILIALVWPIDPTRNTGPPHGVTVEAYESVIGPNWEQIYNVLHPDMMPGKIPTAVGRLVVWRKTA